MDYFPCLLLSLPTYPLTFSNSKPLLNIPSDSRTDIYAERTVSVLPDWPLLAQIPEHNSISQGGPALK